MNWIGQETGLRYVQNEVVQLILPTFIPLSDVRVHFQIHSSANQDMHLFIHVYIHIYIITFILYSHE